MIYYMKLQQEPFEKIARGIKTIELRLFDEKRREIKTGDIIIFTNIIDPRRRICTKVIKLHKFDSFSELYRYLPLDKCGYTAEEMSDADSKDMERYYSIEQQEKYGVLGIEIRLI